MQLKVKQTINYVQKLDKEVFQEEVINRFACQCGKQYNNFPALYLHFQRSHKIKISTKLKQQLCTVLRTGNLRTFTYFYSKEEDQSESQKEKGSLISLSFTQFVNSITNEADKYPALYLCSKLHKYLLKQQSFCSKPFESLRLSSIPNYFNSFMIESVDLMKNKEIYQYNCNILVQLSRWLNFRGFSTIKLQYNGQAGNEQRFTKEESTL